MLGCYFRVAHKQRLRCAFAFFSAKRAGKLAGKFWSSKHNTTSLTRWVSIVCLSRAAYSEMLKLFAPRPKLTSWQSPWNRHKNDAGTSYSNNRRGFKRLEKVFLWKSFGYFYNNIFAFTQARRSENEKNQKEENKTWNNWKNFGADDALESLTVNVFTLFSCGTLWRRVSRSIYTCGACCRAFQWKRKLWQDRWIRMAWWDRLIRRTWLESPGSLPVSQAELFDESLARRWYQMKHYRRSKLCLKLDWADLKEHLAKIKEK